LLGTINGLFRVYIGLEGRPEGLPWALIRLAKCHGFGGLIRVNFLEVWGKFFESVIRVFDVWVILPHAPLQLSNFTPLYRVTKSHRNGRYICVKVLEVWGKILGE
jgi:hypothetical protein